ncbi:hypothetical protein B0H17DRAFT_845166, partial [Mycena rosella]
SPFPSVHRVVTGHNSAGKSSVIADTTQQAWLATPVNPVYNLHYTGESPAVIDNETSKGKWVDEVTQHPELVSGSRSTFRCLDVPPGDV